MLWWILRQIKADDWRIREDAANKLGESRDPKGLDPLIAALSDKNPHVRQAVEVALFNYGDLAVEKLISAFKHQESEIREAARSVLVRIGPIAADHLGAALHSSDFTIREFAAVTLSLMNSDDSLEQLAAAVKKGDSNTREIAAAGLVRVGQPAVKPLAAMLKENKLGARETAAAALVRIGPRAIEPLISALKDSDVREAALEALSKIDAAWTKSVPARLAVPTLIGALQDDNEKSRRTAAIVLGQIGDSRAVEPLMAVILDQADTVQEAVATALGEIGDGRAVPALIDCLKLGSAKGRKAAVASLIRLGQAAVEPLVEALKHKEPGVRESAATVLVRVGHAAVEPLVDVLWKIDQDWVKSSAAQEAVPHFIATMKGGSNALQDSASQLKKAGGASAIRPLITALKAKDAVLSKGMLSSDPSNATSDVEALATTLEDPNADVRQVAIKRLMQIGTGTEDPLIAALKNGNQAIRRASAHALATAGDTRARDVLRADLHHPSDQIVLDAAEALIHLGDTTVIQALASLLKRLGEPSTDSFQLHKRQRAIELLQTVLQENSRELEAEDLRALAALQPPPENKFVASADLKALYAGTASSDPAAHAGLTSRQLAEVARRELSRRNLKP